VVSSPVQVVDHDTGVGVRLTRMKSQRTFFLDFARDFRLVCLLRRSIPTQIVHAEQTGDPVQSAVRDL